MGRDLPKVTQLGAPVLSRQTQKNDQRINGNEDG